MSYSMSVILFCLSIETTSTVVAGREEESRFSVGGEEQEGMSGLSCY